ncbi:MAG: ArnT family glycosyltransferase, partial [Gemmataceae bacterium]
MAQSNLSLSFSPGSSPPSENRSVLAWAPFLWSQVAFPGRLAPSPKESCWLSWLLLIVLPGLLLYPRLNFPLFEPDEGRYAEIPREMLARGEWVVPYLQAEPYLDKPPLLYWLVMVSYKLLGVADWSARLVPALAMHASILLTFGFGKRLLGSRAAFWGALALSLAPGFITIGRLLVLDGLLTLWVTLSLFAVFEATRGDRFKWSWWLTAAVACGIGVLTKGPIALILALPPVWFYRFLSSRSIRCLWLP